MKHLFSIIFVVFIITSAVNSYAVQKEFIGKIGTSYASDPGKFGLDISLNYLFDIDPYFVAGGEVDFFWLRWENNLDKMEEVESLSGELITSTNAFTIPIFFNAQLRLPNLAKKIYVEPFFTIGIGWSFMVLHYSRPEYTDADSIVHLQENIIHFYSGFAWQVVAGVSLKPAEESRIAFIFDFGYRGTSPKREKGTIKYKMSGILIRLGVKFLI